jgi:hypothetical protein
MGSANSREVGLSVLIRIAECIGDLSLLEKAHQSLPSRRVGRIRTRSALRFTNRITPAVTVQLYVENK